ncbi:MAG: hypothetical protein PHP73_05650 [Candidatus Omnitrophica bacterium]|nr:hypothetical protein [Candidatus Omnitrophota bacterium]
MEQKTKFIIIGLIVFSVVCLFFLFQATNQQQTLLRENNDLKSENATLLSKVNRLENDLRGNQSKIDSLRGERDKWAEELNDLQKKYESVARVRDELIEKLKKQSQRQQEMFVAQDALKTLKAENEEFTRQLKSLSSRKIILDQKIQSLQETNSALEKRLNEMNTMLVNRMPQAGSLGSESDMIKSGVPAATLEKKRESVELPAIIVRSSFSPEKPVVPAFGGKILAVNTDNNFVIIDLGSASGVKVGDMFNVYRAQKSIGSIAVIQIRDSISACDIKRTSTPLKIGDNIK